MVNLPYHNEDVKKFSTQIFTAVMGNPGNTKVPHFPSFFISCQVWPKDISQTFWYFATKFWKIKSKILLSATISSKWEKWVMHSVARWLSPKPATSRHEKLLDPAKNHIIHFS